MNIKVKFTHGEIVDLVKKHIKETFGDDAEVIDDAFDVVDDMGTACGGFTVEVDVVLEKPKPVAPGQSWKLLAEVPIPRSRRFKEMSDGSLIEVPPERMGRNSWPKDDPYHGLVDSVC